MRSEDRGVAAGRVHLGVTGSDLVRDKLADWSAQVLDWAAMGFGHADLVIAAAKAGKAIFGVHYVLNCCMSSVTRQYSSLSVGSIDTPLLNVIVFRRTVYVCPSTHFRVYG